MPEELISRISEKMQNNNILCPLIFDENGTAYDYVRSGLLNLADYYIKQAEKCVINLQIHDIALIGGMVSYLYNSKTDIDLVILASIDVPHANADDIKVIFQTLNRGIHNKGYHFSLFQRDIDCWFAEPSSIISSGCGLYSLSDNCWRQKPIRRDFSYTPEEAERAYKAYCDNIHKFVASLPKIDGKWLTFDGCHKLQNYIEQLKHEALSVKENGAEQEYGIEYNCYRFFCKFGGKQHFYNLITDSQNQLINGLEAEDE